MDGYTAYGASITATGSKQTFDCPAPRVVLADLETIAGAPEGMNASGYADLIAKVAAGGIGLWPMLGEWRRLNLMCGIRCSCISEGVGRFAGGGGWS